MNFTPRVITIHNREHAQHELMALNCETAGVQIMSPKAVFKTIKLENVPTKAANLLKQTFLAKGGEVAVAKGSANLSVEYTDVLVCATRKQYSLALQQLKMQPWGLPDLAAAIAATLQHEEEFPKRHFTLGTHTLRIEPGKTLVMGILNITPDSFSDGGRYDSVERALCHMEQMIADGADIIDIGAESTRPYGNSQKVSAEQELERLLPILEKVAKYSTVPISVDTYKAQVAEAALQAGAHMINDVWGLQGDPAMAAVVAKYNVPVFVMHNQQEAVYQRDIMADICAFLSHSIEIAVAAGVDRQAIIVDPGIGFAKTTAHNLTVMARLAELKALGCPILLAASRKRFIGEVLDVPVDERVEGTGAAMVAGVLRGANIVRVHDVKPIVRMVKMADAMVYNK